MARRTLTGRVQLVLFIAAVVTAPAASRAEWFGDVSVGAAFTEKVTVTSTQLTGSGGDTDAQAGAATSVTVGARFGYWFTENLGLAATASYFQPELKTPSSDIDLTVVPLSALLMVRVPLMVSENFPHGQVQPYLGVGPGLFISKASEAGFSSTDTSPGVDLRLGALYQFIKPLGVFGEGRYTSFAGKWSDEGVKLRTDMYSYHLLGGLRYSFE